MFSSGNSNTNKVNKNTTCTYMLMENDLYIGHNITQIHMHTHSRMHTHTPTHSYAQKIYVCICIHVSMHV